MSDGFPGRKVTFQTGPPDGPPRHRPPRRTRFHVTPAQLTRLLPPELLLEHVSRLPSRGARRLSQCPEEESEHDDATTESSLLKKEQIRSVTAEEPIRKIFLHRRHTDRTFVDTSLVALKSNLPKKAITFDKGSDLWVKRNLPHRKKEGSIIPGQEAMYDPYRIPGKADTWNARGGAAAAAILARAEAERRGKGRRGNQVYHTVTGAVSTAHTKASHPPSIFEVFRPRSKSDAATKKPNFIGHMKNAMTNSLKSQGSGSEGEHSRGPVAKVIHLFRHRSQSAVSAEEKRKAVRGFGCILHEFLLPVGARGERAQREATQPVPRRKGPVRIRHQIYSPESSSSPAAANRGTYCYIRLRKLDVAMVRDPGSEAAGRSESPRRHVPLLLLPRSPSPRRPPHIRTPSPRRDVTPNLRARVISKDNRGPVLICTPPQDKGGTEINKSRSIQDLLRQLGRAVLPRSKSPRRSSCLLEVPSPTFRTRSKSLDDGTRRPTDCEATYRIYDQILAEGALRRSSLEKRRLSLGGGVAGHRGSEPTLDPNHAAILFRDSRGLPVADPFLEKVSLTDLEEDESQIFVKFFKFHRCYGLIPTSAKLVVFDTQLLVKKAFFALLYNGVRAAPLWDAGRHRFVGMLTITDFIKILHMYHSTGTMSLEQMEEHKLETWRALLKDSPDLISIGPDCSLYDAIQVLIENRIHRLPVIDPETGNVLYILTHKRILRFLFLYINDLPRPSFLDKSLCELSIGTYDCIETATEETTIITALDKFLDRRVSALPVVDSDGRLTDIFAKFDVINLAAEKTYDKLDMPLKKVNENRNDWFEGVHKCSMDDTLYCIIERLVRAEVHRLVVTDDDDKVIGILSLSDLLQFLVLRPTNKDEEEDHGLGSRCDSPISQIQSEETILEGEEDDCDALESISNTNSASFPHEVTVSGGE